MTEIRFYCGSELLLSVQSEKLSLSGFEPAWAKHIVVDYLTKELKLKLPEGTRVSAMKSWDGKWVAKAYVSDKMLIRDIKLNRLL